MRTLFPRRDVSIDALKGFGIAFIINGHTHAVEMLFPSSSHWLAYIVAVYVALFFVAAGLVDKGRTGKSEWQKKAKRLLIPYFVYGALIIAIHQLLSPSMRVGSQPLIEAGGLLYARYAAFAHLPMGTGSNPCLLPVHAPLWFLPALFCSFLFYYPLQRLKNGAQRLGVMMLYLLLSWLLTYSPLLLPWSLDTAMVGALLIYAGYSVKTLRLSLFGAVIALATAIGIIGWCLLDTNLSIRIYGTFGAGSILPLLLATVLFVLGLRRLFQWQSKRWLVRFLAFLGRHSLRLMIFHYPLWRLCTGTMREHKVLCFLVTYVGSLLLSVAIEQWQKRSSAAWVKYL